MSSQAADRLVVPAGKAVLLVVVKRWLRLACFALGGLVCLLVSTYVTLPPLNLERFSNVSPSVVARDGELLNVFLSKDDAYRIDTRVADVDPRYVESLLALEDQWFWWHPGVNPLALLRASAQWAMTGEIVSGGSTITMQVARLLEPKTRTLWHKWVEIVRAVELELRYSKADLLRMYMTMVPMGGNVEGVRAASLRYWGVEPRNLSLSEVALLLAVPQSPEVRRPDRRSAHTLAAIQWVGQRLVNAGLFPLSDLDELSSLPFQSISAYPNVAWHFSRRALAAAKQEGAPLGVINSSLDFLLQKGVNRKAQQFAERLGTSENLSVMVTNGRTGEVLAYVGSLGLQSDAGYVDLTRATRSPGSTLKPFIYGMAFDDGLLDAQTVLYDTPKAYGDYAPGNFDKGHRGPVRAGVALQDSLNIPAVAVLSDLGPDLFQQAWGEAGMAMKLPKGADANLGLALGAVGTRLQDLVQAYGAFVNDGYVAPLRLTQFDNRNSNVRGKALLTSQSANEIKKILASASPIQGRLSRSKLQGTRQASFKTGTSYGYRDTWAVGVKGEYVVGVWVGRPDGTPVVGQTGRTVALRLANDVADGLHVKGEIEPWTAEPVSQATLDRPAPRLIYPSDGTNIVLTTPPTLSREVGIQLSGLSDQLEVFLNGNAVPIEHIQRGTISVPTDGSYEIQIVEGGKQVEKSMFSVLSGVF